MPNIDREQALSIAREDALAVYRDLDAYAVSVELLDESVWKVDYELRETGTQGGGPHYLISAESGEVLEKRYEQ